MPQTKAANPHLALASLVCGLSSILIAWSAIGASLNAFIYSSPVALGFHYVGVGIRKKNELGWGDHKAIAPMVWDSLVAGHKQTSNSIVAPMVTELRSIPGIEKVNTPVFDVSPILTHSAAIVAPTNTGKSYFLSLVMVERQKRFPNSPFTICSIDTWKRNHTWMGLASCPKWLQKIYICLGYKYEDATDSFTEAIHKETVDAIESLHKLMESRARAVRDRGGEDGVDLSLTTVIVDEFPQFWNYITVKQRDDIALKIKDLLVRGQGYRCVLWVVSQDDAVNMMGIKESEKKQLFICSLFKDDVDGNGSRAALVNSVNGRRVLFEHGGKGAVMPVPHLDDEPKLDWSYAIGQGKFRGWIDELQIYVQHHKTSGASKSDVWNELVSRTDFPGQKRQSMDNPDYQYFSNTIWS